MQLLLRSYGHRHHGPINQSASCLAAIPQVHQGATRARSMLLSGTVGVITAVLFSDGALSPLLASHRQMLMLAAARVGVADLTTWPDAVKHRPLLHM